MPHICDLPKIVDGVIEAHTVVFNIVTEYLNTNYPNEYIAYNLTKDLDRSGKSLNQVMEYPFPLAVQVDSGDEENPYSFVTAPPTLESLFLVVIEMSAWLNQGDEESQHVVALHQADLKSSNVTMLLSCLIAFIHRNVFKGGSKEVIPYVQKYAGDYSFNRMSIS